MSKKALRNGMNGALWASAITAVLRDLFTDAPTWDILLVPIATAIFCAAVWYVNKQERI